MDREQLTLKTRELYRKEHEARRTARKTLLEGAAAILNGIGEFPSSLTQVAMVDKAIELLKLWKTL